MPRAGRKATFALAVLLVCVMGFLVVWGAPAGAQDANATTGGGATPDATGGESPPRTLVVRALDEGCSATGSPCWDLSTLVALPGDNVRVLADFTNSAQPHNFAIREPINLQTPERGAAAGGVHELTFTLPEEMTQPIEFVCTVHETSMFGAIYTPAQVAAAGAHGEEVHHLGVHFLAYWVGVIAFAILFVVYGITFFLFKYNETSATTDHWDRAGSEAPSKGRRAAVNVLVLALLIGAVAAAAMIILSLRGDISDLDAQVSSLQGQVATLTKDLASAQAG